MKVFQEIGILSVVAMSLFTGCSRDDASSQVTGQQQSEVPKPATPVTGDRPATVDVTRPPQERAATAKDALFNELSTQLLAAMSNGGPAKAIEACSKLAPKVAKQVSEEHQVSIGRTAVRLRNEENLPPEWALPLLADSPTKPVFTELEGGGTGALFPIMLKVQCLTCHGPKDEIAPEILSELTRLYPNDTATGFKEGDLRGWFWVEVPGAAFERFGTNDQRSEEK
jgi:hypothetical protein